jgi:hypothetical protein
VFYVKDVFGLKITQPSKLRQIQRMLIASLTPADGDPVPEAAPRRAAGVGH